MGARTESGDRVQKVLELVVRFWKSFLCRGAVPSLRQILHVLEGAGEHYFEPVGIRSDMGVSLFVSSSELADRCVDADVLILEQVEEVVVVAWSETLLVGDAVELRPRERTQASIPESESMRRRSRVYPGSATALSTARRRRSCVA